MSYIEAILALFAIVDPVGNIPILLHIAEHSHEAQWGVVLEGKIDLTIEGVERRYSKGDRVFIPKGAKHSAKVYAGYADVSFFDQKDRYKPK